VPTTSFFPPLSKRNADRGKERNSINIFMVFEIEGGESISKLWENGIKAWQNGTKEEDDTASP
jgi:hypothetical protein